MSPSGGKKKIFNKTKGSGPRGVVDLPLEEPIMEPTSESGPEESAREQVNCLSPENTGYKQNSLLT